MNHLKKIVTLIVTISILSSMCLAGTMFSASATGTGAGLAEWALNAYYSGWAYVYGGSSPGAVDCSGLIYSYTGGIRTGDAQLYGATESGSVSNGIPRVHGLGLYHPGHVGVYVGNGMAVDARNESAGVCYSSVDYMGWTMWFKLCDVTYPTYGWEEFNGNYYYYEDGQYIVDTSRTIDGVTYYFGSDGVSDTTPSDTSSVAESSSSSTDNGSSGNNSSSSTSQEPSSVTVKYGSQGEMVTKIQERLQELGFFTGSIDGYFGSETEKAYKEFQKAAGVTVDGISGASDQELLFSDNAPYASQNNEKDENTAEEITSVQEKLKSLNYYSGVCDGTIGTYTTEAILAFQIDNDLEATGELDEATLSAIMADNAKSNPRFETTEATEATTEETTEATEASETKPSPTSVYTFNAFELNSSGIMGPNQIVTNANTSSFILDNAAAKDNETTANDVAVKTNQLAKNAVSKFTSNGFTEVGPQARFKINGVTITLFTIVMLISLTSIYMLVRANKERKRKAARAAMRMEKKMSRLQSETRYW